MTHGAEQDGLLRRASRAMFWNALMLPGITAINLAAVVLLRRGFGLGSGTYDTALGLLNTILTHSALGLPFAVTQFVPGLARASGRSSVTQFIKRVIGLRAVLLAAVAAGVNVYAGPLADQLHLGDGGVGLIRTVSVLAVLRAASDLAVDVMQALLAQPLATLVQLAQAVGLFVAVVGTLAVGASMPALFGIMTAAAFGTTVLSFWMAHTQVRAVPVNPPAGGSGDRDVSWARCLGFAAFMYVNDASNYFATPAFASPALAAMLHGPETTAVFNVAFQIPMMAVVVILSAFQGLYRPLFAGLMDEGHPERIRTAFSEISKVQAALLIPAGVGLFVLLPEYVDLLFGVQFGGAVSLARVLTLFLVAEALLNLGLIMLAVDKRYTAALGSQSVRIAVAPLFILLALRGHLLLAAAVFGGGRLLTVAAAYLVARRRYGIRLPMAFGARVSLAAALMGVVVVASGLGLPSSWPGTLARTAIGLVVFLVGLRFVAAIGPREQDLLSRTRIPGNALLLRWFVRSS